MSSYLFLRFVSPAKDALFEILFHLSSHAETRCLRSRHVIRLQVLTIAFASLDDMAPALLVGR